MLTDTSKPRPSGVVCKNCSPGSHPLTCCVTEDTVLSNQHSLRIQPSDLGFPSHLFSIWLVERT